MGLSPSTLSKSKKKMGMAVSSHFTVLQTMRLMFDILKANRGYIQIGAVMIIALLGVMVLVPTEGVREIRNADRFSNFALVEPRPLSDDWPWWRGTDRRSVAAFSQFPSHWPITANDGWPVTIKGRGNSTPLIWHNQLFFLTSDPETEQISLESRRRSTGVEIWKTDLHRGGFPIVREKNTHASSTPACDGQYVYVVAVTHGRLRISSVDMNGQLAWQNSPGSYSSAWGYSSSPVLYQSLVIVVADQKSTVILPHFIGSQARSSGALDAPMVKVMGLRSSPRSVDVRN